MSRVACSKRGVRSDVLTEMTCAPFAKVNSPWPNPRLEIALHSTGALRETGLRMWLLEKSQDRATFDAE